MLIRITSACLLFSLTCFPPNDLVSAPDRLQTTIWGVTIGVDNLRTVQDKLGPTEECHVSEHLTTLGYVVGGQSLLFEFSDVGAGDVTGFILRRSERKRGCVLSPLKGPSPRPKTDGGVHLGMKREEFLHLFGPPHRKSSRGAWVYQWLQTEDLSESDKKALARSPLKLRGVTKADVLTTIEARFSMHTLAYFYISKVSTL